MPTTGSLALRYNTAYYTLYFSDHGWLVADLVQYVDEVLSAPDPQVAILKLLGYTLQIQRDRPPRHADHWVEVDLEKRVVATNSDRIRQAVEETTLNERDVCSNLALHRLRDVLDRGDFTVELFD